MHLGAIDYVLWFSGFALQVGILLTIYVRGLYREYPFFALYQIVQVLSTPVLFGVMKTSYSYYYCGYWISFVVSVLVSAAVLYEVARAPFCRGARLSQRTAIVFITLVSMMAAAAVAAAIVVKWAITSHAGNSIDGSTNAIMLAQHTIGELQCGLTLLLLIFWKRLRMPRRDPGLGIMLGFGLFAIVNMMMAAAMWHVVFVPGSMLRQINGAAYVVACLIWLVSVLRAPVQTRWAEFRIAI